MSLAQIDLEEFIGEIIESSTSQFMSECRELNGAPPFGSFIKTNGALPVYGLVFNVCTHSIEPNRRATAYGLTEQELREEQPQIFELLKTEFEAVIIGYGDERGPQQVLPPQPPGIHSFVFPCKESEIKALTNNGDFLRSILGGNRLPADDLIIASVRNAWTARAFDMPYLVSIGKDLCRLIRDDYDRLSSIMRRISN
ncbi:MAG: hypothetical protein QGG64_00130 [Candidatus Latescibacteria bacterium]|jgi:hypothetical protein|nr:hypothetical protein [Candidatus Latescibacterota bacterium]